MKQTGYEFRDVLPVVIPLFFGGGAFNIFIVVIPVIMLFFFARRCFIKGIVMTGFKG